MAVLGSIDRSAGIPESEGAGSATHGAEAQNPRQEHEDAKTVSTS